MRRKALAALILLGIAAVPAISLAGCGSAQPGPGAKRSAGANPAEHGLSVTPSSGSPTTTFSLRFTALASSGAVGGSRIGYTLSLTGFGGTGCIGARSVPTPAATKGEPVTITLDPAHLGGTWCTGTYTARVVEVETPVCTAGMMCPQFVRVIGTVASATFRVESSS
jgi:hypothetical protein